MSYLVYQILKLDAFLIGAGLTGAAMMVVFLLWAVRPKRGPAQYRKQAFFYGLTAADVAYLSAAALQAVFAASAVLGQVQIERIHLYTVAALWLVRTGAKPVPVPALVDAAYSVLMTVVLLVCNLLAGFMGQTGGDLWIWSMYGLLNLFVIELALYYFLYSLRPLLREREEGPGGLPFGVKLPALKLRAGRRKVQEETDGEQGTESV